MIVITNAKVLRARGVEHAAVVIDGDTVVAVGEVGDEHGGRVIDAGGSWLGPGLVDLHVHFRDPGQTWKEDTVSGAEAAVSGGFTAVVTMPNTDPPIDNAKMVGLATARAADVLTLRIETAGALTRSRSGVEMAELDAMYEAGVRVFTDDGDSVADGGLLWRIMRYLSDLPGAVVAQHAEDISLSRGGHLHEGSMSALHGIEGLPAAAEDLVVARDIALAEETGARVHIQHVSTAVSVDLIRKAKDRGAPVSAEVTPHHLSLDESALSELDPNLKMYPPLRAGEDRLAVVEGLRDGTLDAVATDHAPHSQAEKDVPFEEAPRGVTGLETAAAITSRAVDADQQAFFDRLSIAPARIAGLGRHGLAVEPGTPANLVLFDPERRWVPGPFASKADNSPFKGMELVGKVLATIHEGSPSFQEGLG